MWESIDSWSPVFSFISPTLYGADMTVLLSEKHQQDNKVNVLDLLVISHDGYITLNVLWHPQLIDWRSSLVNNFTLIFKSRSPKYFRKYRIIARKLKRHSFCFISCELQLWIVFYCALLTGNFIPIKLIMLSLKNFFSFWIVIEVFVLKVDDIS